MKIKVMTLEGCEYCANFKHSLAYKGVRFEIMTCEKYPETCDSLESLVNSTYYPIVMIHNHNDEMMEIVFVTKDMSQLQEGIKIQNGISLIPTYSGDKILEYLLNKLHLTI